MSLKAWRDGDEVIFEVADTGPGISAGASDSPLRSLLAGESRRSSRRRDSDLPITKGIVEAHGGRIWFESEVGKGSRFYVAIPVLH